MDELERRFGSRLRLSEKERVGIQIAEEECGDFWKGSQFTMVAMVLTNRAVHRDGFISVFSRLWRGVGGVSIKEIGDRRFLVRFANMQDKLRVLDMEPWTFRESLVVVAETCTGTDAREAELRLSTMWVQFHGIPPFNMTTMVAQKIGSLVGRVLEVDQAEGEDCIGRFLRVRIQLDVEQALMRGAFIQFPDDGSKWVSFRYEHIPEYCFVCGHLGHPSRTCVEKLNADHLSVESREEVLRTFSGLEAVEDLRGRRLHHGSRSGFRRESGSGRSNIGGRWRDDGPSQAGAASASRRGSVTQSSGTGPEQRGVGVNDTAFPPSKSLYHTSSLADKIRSLRDDEERERRIREEAWHAGMFGRRDENVSAIQEDLAAIQYAQVEAEVLREHEGVSQATEPGQLIDLNVEHGNSLHENADSTAHGLDLMIGMGNEQVTGTQGSDPFSLGPIIEKTMHRSIHGKSQRKNKRDYFETVRSLEAATNSETVPIPIMIGNGRKKARRCLSLTLNDDLLQVVETGQNGSPRAP